MRGGIIAVKQGEFKVPPSCDAIQLVVHHASRIGVDGSYTFGKPSWLRDEPDIKLLLSNKVKRMYIIIFKNNIS